MKNTQNGFAIPLLIGIIALLVIGGGIYIYKNKKVETPIINTETQQFNENQRQTNTQTPEVINQQNISNNSADNSSLPILKVNLGEEFNLNLGQVAEINNQNIKVKFNKVYPAGGGTGPMAFHYEPLFTFIIDNQSYDQSQTKYRIKSDNYSLNENTTSIHLSVMTIENYCINETGLDPEAQYACFRNAARDLGDASYCNLITDTKRISQCKNDVKDYVK